jgi:serine protease Do
MLLSGKILYVCQRYFLMLLLLPFMVAVCGCATLGGNAQYAVLSAKNNVAPALVHIRPLKEVFIAGRRAEVPTVGSGFIISDDGYIVTNEHVAGESSQVWCVFSDNTELEARVVGTDADTDIAVLKVESDKKLPHVKIGRSVDLESGQLVLAMGSPHGLARSVSLGIISVTDRYLGDSSGLVSPYNNWIQTDAAINPGNSGGPLVNMRGEVIGVNSRVLSGAENVGFAIPVDTAKEVLDAIIRDGQVHRSYLGMTFQEMAAKTDDQTVHGVVIADVAPLSPAQEAGIAPGDLLTAINDRSVDARFEEDLPRVRKAIADLPIGATVTLHLVRGENPMEIDVVTEEKLSLKGGQTEFTEWGFTAVELTPELARRAQLAGRSGVLISGSQPGGIAASSGLGQGDIILEMDGEPVQTLDGFQQSYQLRLESKQKLVLLFVQRGAVTRFVLINTGTEQELTLDKELLDHVD